MNNTSRIKSDKVISSYLKDILIGNAFLISNEQDNYLMTNYGIYLIDNYNDILNFKKEPSTVNQIIDEFKSSEEVTKRYYKTNGKLILEKFESKHFSIYINTKFYKKYIDEKVYIYNYRISNTFLYITDIDDKIQIVCIKCIPDEEGFN